MENSFQSAYVDINGVPTNILTWGRWLEESLGDAEEIIICITGNPGLPGFYTEFGHTIHKNLGLKTPVWIIGHAGHDEPSKKSLKQVPTLKHNEHLYDLSGQIEHKLSFIQKYVPENKKIYLVGHSIGAWMVLELMKHDSIKPRIKKCFLLFPTIERMADSYNGKIFQLFSFLSPLYIYLLHFIYYMPIFVRLFIIKIYFWLFSIPKIFLKPAIKYSKPTSMEKVIFLAKDEMKVVREFDELHIKRNKKLLKFYYGATDGWVPVKYFNEIKEKIDDLDAQLCQKGISHSFVLQHSEMMGNILAEWIIQDKN
ncbi:lipid droplet-associated hydrolase [Condylostylus longicornis]|uniref:lipid droplet-associated hydrolase n=1 Tax=Condylostylus longicornis TaxID=2530218 RepID=UPI00244DDDC8|nr:lipid droplet-associated hydrolase [Condylostylus longicornis]